VKFAWQLRLTTVHAAVHCIAYRLEHTIQAIQDGQLPCLTLVEAKSSLQEQHAGHANNPSKQTVLTATEIIYQHGCEAACCYAGLSSVACCTLRPLLRCQACDANQLPPDPCNDAVATFAGLTDLDQLRCKIACSRDASATNHGLRFHCKILILNLHCWRWYIILCQLLRQQPKDILVWILADGQQPVVAQYFYLLSNECSWHAADVNLLAMVQLQPQQS
jgi:hypothetical protein